MEHITTELNEILLDTPASELSEIDLSTAATHEVSETVDFDTNEFVVPVEKL